jgi:hypothetical protein
VCGSLQVGGLCIGARVDNVLSGGLTINGRVILFLVLLSSSVFLGVRGG